MPSSFVACFASAAEASRSYALCFPDATVAVLDARDPIGAARRLAELAIPLHTVSLASENPGGLSREVRRIFDGRGLTSTRIMAAGPLDEEAISELVAGGAPIDLYAIGAVTGEVTPPAAVYSPVALDSDGTEAPVRPGADAVWPGVKQTFRSFDSSGHIRRDVVALEGESVEGAILLHPALAEGALGFQKPGLESVRKYAQRALESLPEGLLMATEPGLTPRASAALEELRVEMSRAGSTP
jgi:nicotinate phosphoribosyltransferase